MTNGDRVSIQYRDFWDVPRIFLATYRGQLFLFDCPFDEEVEDYPQVYHVFAMPPVAEQELAGSWVDLSDKALSYLGDVPLDGVLFDPSKRKTIDPTVLDELMARKAVAG